ncbi:MAG: SEL1-like repeat protein [Magnetococcales bacterium]|nr:SEL1-like repeat protein [Magnetococcales bacterium]
MPSPCFCLTPSTRNFPPNRRNFAYSPCGMMRGKSGNPNKRRAGVIMRIVPLFLFLLLFFCPCAVGLTDESTGATVNKAEEWLRRAAEQGDAKAQYGLGRMLEKGIGVTQDYAGAVAWYRKAAEQGVATAQNQLGDLYRDGRGVAQDYAEAVSWYRKAAEQGNAVAQASLGRLYKEGLGVPRDDDQATLWSRKAAGQDNPKAQAQRHALVAKPAPVVVPAKPRATRPTICRVTRHRKKPLRHRKAMVAVRHHKKLMVLPRWAHHTIDPTSLTGGGSTTAEQAGAGSTAPVAGVAHGQANMPSQPMPDFQSEQYNALHPQPVEPASPPVEPASTMVPGPVATHEVAALKQEAAAEEKEPPVLHFRIGAGDEPGVVRGGAVEQELPAPSYQPSQSAPPSQPVYQPSQPAYQPSQPVYQPANQPMMRFVDNGDGTIIDHKRGLVGLKNADCFGRRQWEEAKGLVQALANGTCRLNDGSRPGDWRLPTRNEMHILLDWQESGLFWNVIEAGYYWSSTLHEANAGHVWYLMPTRGMLYNGSPERRNAIWPVRALNGP